MSGTEDQEPPSSHFFAVQLPAGACCLIPLVPLPPLWPAGCAGTGKSLLLCHILQSLPRDTTFVTGTTGLAACHLGGTTINSFAGIGRAEGSIGGWIDWLHFYNPQFQTVASLRSNTLLATQPCVPLTTAAACCRRLPPAMLPAESLVRMASRGKSLQRWRATTHLIIDEVRQAGRRSSMQQQEKHAAAAACRQNRSRPTVAAPSCTLLTACAEIG
jgi:hypothetical protein